MASSSSSLKSLAGSEGSLASFSSFGGSEDSDSSSFGSLVSFGGIGDSSFSTSSSDDDDDEMFDEMNRQHQRIFVVAAAAVASSLEFFSSDELEEDPRQSKDPDMSVHGTLTPSFNLGKFEELAPLVNRTITPRARSAGSKRTMVWFQCESCGENFKKPKLQNHFQSCAARKLSCINCGVVFDQQSVQAHTSCVTEEEKYGPKGVIKRNSGSSQKVQKGQKRNSSEIDLHIGLASKPPWACSLCNVIATSFETLEGHSQGKKHRSKVKAALGKSSLTVAPEQQHTVSAGVIPVKANLAESTLESKGKLEKAGIVASPGQMHPQEGGTKIRKKRNAGSSDTCGQENVIAASENLEAAMELPDKKKRKDMKGTTGSGEKTAEKKSTKGKKKMAAASTARQSIGMKISPNSLQSLQMDP